MPDKSDEVILHVKVDNRETLTYEIVLTAKEYHELLGEPDGYGNHESCDLHKRLEEVVIDGEYECIDDESGNWELDSWKVVDEKYKPPPEPFQVNRDKIIADLRASIAPNGPTAEQVDTVEKLLNTIPEGWRRLLPLPECEMHEADDTSGQCPTLRFCSGRAELRVDIVGHCREYPGIDVFVSQFDSRADIKDTLDMDGDWQPQWPDCLRWFIGESLET